MSDVERIKDAVRIEDYISMRCPQLKRAGTYYKMNCPRHADKSPSFVVNPESQTWRDYGACGVGGDVIAFVMWYDNVDFGDALKELADFAHITLTPLTPQNKEKADKRERLYTLMDAAAKLYHHHLLSSGGNAAYRYLVHSRGLSEVSITRAVIGYAPDQYQWATAHFLSHGFTEDELIAVGLSKRSDNGKLYDFFRNRVLIPYRDMKGRVVAFTGRAASEKQMPKYLHSPTTDIFEKSRIVHRMPEFDVLQAKGDISTVIVTEGSLDPISASNSGHFNVVSQMGTSLSSDQLSLLCKPGIERLIFCLDKDDAGRKATERLVKEHAHAAADKGVALYVMTAPHGKDPDDTFREHPELWQGAVDAARPAVDVLIEQAVAGLPANATSTDKQKIAQSLTPLLKGSNALLQEDSLKALAKALGYSLESMMAWTDKQASVRVLPKTPAPKPVKQGPTDDHWLIFYIVRFEADEYFNRADAILCHAGLGLRPSEAWMQPCFMGLNADDFTHPDCKRLFTILKTARERNEPLGDVLELETMDTDLYEAYERCLNVDQWELVIGCKSEISLQTFLDRVLTVRMAHVDALAAPLRETDRTLWANYQSAWAALDDMRSAL